MEIRWNKEKHERHLTEQAERDQKQSVNQAKAQVAHEYTRWAGSLKRQIKGGKLTTVQQLVDEVHTLISTVNRICSKVIGMEDWRKFTVSMLEEKVGQIILTDAGTRNQIVEYLPDEVRKAEDRVVAPESAVFSTLEELKEVPFVAKWLGMPKTVGLFTQGSWLKLLWEDGEFSTIGMCLNKVGLEKLLTQARLEQAFSKKKS